MTIDCVYFNDYIRCFRDGRVERLDKRFKNPKWRIIENTDNENGYNDIKINGVDIKRHRLMAYCFLGLKNIVGKSGANDCIDHINGDKLDNRVENLRITTHQGNQQNQTKAKGYYWNNEKNKWRASIGINGKLIHLGYYDTEEEAHEAYLRAKPIYHTI